MKKRAVIIANGIFRRSSRIVEAHREGDLIICADGGTLHALDAGLLPDIVIGDLDSLPGEVLRELEAKKVKIVRHPQRKDSTDLELALRAAMKLEAGEIVVIALSGGRIDQFLGNLLLLARDDWKDASISIIEEEQTGWILRGPAETTIAGEPGDLLSLVPLAGPIGGVHIRGAEWELAGDSFEPGTTRLLSNVFEAKEVTVGLERGTCLVVHTAVGAG